MPFQGKDSQEAWGCVGSLSRGIQGILLQERILYISSRTPGCLPILRKAPAKLPYARSRMMEVELLRRLEHLVLVILRPSEFRQPVFVRKAHHLALAPGRSCLGLLFKLELRSGMRAGTNIRALAQAGESGTRIGMAPAV